VKQQSRSQELRRHPWFVAFFTFGAIMCGLTIVVLLFPGTAFDSVWRLNPDARLAFQSLGNWSIALMVAVGTLCGVAAGGLWRGTGWSVRLAIAILSANIIGDTINTLVRHDYRALFGIPISAAMIYYLVRSTRAQN
jgi:hypothetical protein